MYANAMAANQKLIRELRTALRELADPVKAPIMQAYMKSAMPYLGIQAAPFRKITKAVLADIRWIRFRIGVIPRWHCGAARDIAKNATPSSS